jgi:preprotein translocase subunit SecG
MVVLSIIILVLCFFLALFVLAQNPKGGGLAAGFTGAQQIGGVQRTADFLEKGTWTLAGAVMVLCLISAGVRGGGQQNDGLSTSTEAPTTEQTTPDKSAPAGDQTPAGDDQGQDQPTDDGDQQ